MSIESMTRWSRESASRTRAVQGIARLEGRKSSPAATLFPAHPTNQHLEGHCFGHHPLFQSVSRQS